MVDLWWLSEVLWWAPGAASGIMGVAAHGGRPAHGSGVYPGVVAVAGEGEVVDIGAPTGGVGPDMVDLASVGGHSATRRRASALGGDQREALTRVGQPSSPAEVQGSPVVVEHDQDGVAVCGHGQRVTDREYPTAHGTPAIPDEGAHVVDVFEQFTAGATLASLVTMLNTAGVPNTQGRPWQRSAVHKMLRNPRYIGERWVNGEYVAPGTWEPLVDADTFAAAGARLRDQARRLGASYTQKWLGAGLYRCGVCEDDTTMMTSWGSYRLADRTIVNTRRYKCRNARHLLRKADPLDEYVTLVIAERLRGADVLTLMEDDRDVAAVRTLRAEANGLRARSDSLAAEFADGLLTARQVHVASERITGRLVAVEAKLAAHGQRSALAGLAGASDPGAAWAALDVAQRAAVVDTLATVTVLPGARGRAAFDSDTVRIEWKGRQP